MDKAKSKIKSSKSLPLDKGGKAMAGFSGAAKAEAGKTSVGGRSGNTSFSPDKGGKAMAGYTQASPARPK